MAEYETAISTTVDSMVDTSASDVSSPVIMASWNGKTWSVNSAQIKHLGDISASLELEVETNDDKEGSPPTKTMNLKAQEFSFQFLANSYAGVDPREEFESWKELVGKYAPFYLGAKRFGPQNVQLIKTELSNGQINDFGELYSAEISVSFQEYAPEAAKDKETVETSSATSAAGLQSISESVTSAVDVGASTADKAAKKVTNIQLS